MAIDGIASKLKTGRSNVNVVGVNDCLSEQGFAEEKLPNVCLERTGYRENATKVRSEFDAMLGTFEKR